MLEFRSGDATAAIGTGMGLLAAFLVGLAMFIGPLREISNLDFASQAHAVFKTHQGQMWITVVLMSQALLPLTWFVLYAIWQLSASAPRGWSSDIAFVSGWVGLLGLFAGTLLLAVAAYRAGGADVSSVESLLLYSVRAYFIGSLGFGAMAGVGAQRWRMGSYPGDFHICTVPAVLVLFVAGTCPGPV